MTYVDIDLGKLETVVKNLQQKVMEVRNQAGSLLAVREMQQEIAQLELILRAAKEEYWQSSSSPNHWDEDYEEDWASSSYQC